MIERWGREQVLGLAPDTSAHKAACGVAKPAKWTGTGCDERAVWGRCQGGGTSAYRASVDLSEPAFRCTCPSRKFPCKHALGLLLLWSDGTVGDDSAPDWVTEWLAQRQDRADKAQARRREEADRGTAPATGDSGTAGRRERRVDDGVDELVRWLRDQVAHGLTRAEKAPYSMWDDVARRLVDAQAGALAGRVRGLASIPRQGDDWPQRLLEEYALLWLLTTAFRRRDELPESLRTTVRSHVGFTMSRDDVLAGERVRDHWYVAGSHDVAQDRLVTRRVWLRGQETGRSALVLSFAVPGRALDASLLVGGTIDADLAFHPGALPLRALVAERHSAPVGRPPRGTTVEDMLAEYAAALSRDPWLDRWPVVLANVRPGRVGGGVSHLIDERGDALPLRTSSVPWRLPAVSGGRPLTVCGEWSPRGLLPLSAWHDEEGLVVL